MSSIMTIMIRVLIRFEGKVDQDELVESWRAGWYLFKSWKGINEDSPADSLPTVEGLCWTHRISKCTWTEYPTPMQALQL
jgi:hypothetical protein